MTCAANTTYTPRRRRVSRRRGTTRRIAAWRAHDRWHERSQDAGAAPENDLDWHRSEVRHRAQFLYRWQHHVLSALETGAKNSQLLHPVDQRSALQSKFGGCACRAADYPIDGFQRTQNQLALCSPQCSWRTESTLSPRRAQRIPKHATL